MKKEIIFLLLLLLNSPLLCMAELVNCDGKWTNKPCEKPVQARIAEKPIDPRLSNPDFVQKKQLLLSVAAYSAELSKLGINFPARDFETLCRQEDVSAKECEDNFQKLQSSFSASVEAAQNRIKTEGTSTKQASDQATSEKTQARSQGTTINIIKDDDYYWPNSYPKEHKGHNKHSGKDHSGKDHHDLGRHPGHPAIPRVNPTSGGSSGRQLIK